MVNSLSIHIALRYFRSSKFNYFSRLVQGLSILGIGIGVSILIVISSIFNGFHAEIKQSLQGLQPHAIITHENFWWTDWQVLHHQLQQDKNITKISAKIRTYGMIASPTHHRPVQLLATWNESNLERKKQHNHIPGVLDATLSSDLLNELWLEAGDTFGVLTASQVDFSGSEPVALRLKVKSPADQPIALLRRSVEIDINDFTEQLNLNPNTITEIHINTADILTARKTLAPLEKTLPTSLSLTHSSDEFTSLLSALSMQRKLMTIVLSLVVVIAAFNLSASLVMNVMERKSEIAQLQTMGMNKKDIIGIFACQSFMLAGIGFSVGSLFGITIASHITGIVDTIEAVLGIKFISDQVFMLDHLPSVVCWYDVLAIGIGTLLLAILSAIYPASMAIRIDPAETLRYE